MSSKMVIQESARTAPVGAAWAAMLGADPATQVSLAVGLLTCVYLLAQLWLIVRRARIERRKLEMLQREHAATLELTEAQREQLRRDVAGGEL
ncbi:hypothetical protein EQG41_20925 [Billgrantia azerbaijanica]|nr:hypothetical protein EQG41_20925 [Halomonas azerbaijanica]